VLAVATTTLDRKTSTSVLLAGSGGQGVPIVSTGHDGPDVTVPRTTAAADGGVLAVGCG